MGQETNLVRIRGGILSLAVAAGAFLLATPVPRAQAQMRQQAIPFAVRFDPVQLLAERPLSALPMWIKSVNVQHYNAAGLNLPSSQANALSHTSVRLHLRKHNFLAPKVEIRLSLAPGDGAGRISSWTETGTEVFHSEPIGSKETHVSETVLATTEGADYLEIDLPGDGSRLKGLFASAMRYAKVLQAVDFNAPPTADAFGNNISTLPPRSEDRYLWSRVDAVLESGAFALNAGQSEALEFELVSQPECALVTFEARNIPAEAPPVLQLNSQDLSAPSLSMPDLADPAWTSAGRGSTLLRYTGWIRVQQFLSGAVLQKGKNLLEFQNVADDEPIEIRRVELQTRARR